MVGETGPFGTGFEHWVLLAAASGLAGDWASGAQIGGIGGPGFVSGGVGFVGSRGWGSGCCC